MTNYKDVEETFRRTLTYVPSEFRFDVIEDNIKTDDKEIQIIDCDASCLRRVEVEEFPNG